MLTEPERSRAIIQLDQIKEELNHIVNTVEGMIKRILKDTE